MAQDVHDVGDTIGSALGSIARQLSDGASSNGHGHAVGDAERALSGLRGVAAGAVLAAAAPLAGKAVKKAVVKGAMPSLDTAKDAKRAIPSLDKAKGVGAEIKQAGSGVKNVPTGVFKNITKGAKSAVSKGVSKAADKNIKQSGGPAGIAAKAAGSKLTPGGGGGKGQKGTPGVGKGRRMPVEQAAEIAVPLSVAYNQWTQFEEWPQFMHRVVQVSQQDDCTISFKTKMWGMSKDFVAEIIEQRPDERIQWNVGEGVTHTGVVTFHELGPRLTRVQVTLDLEPGSLIEKMARGMRHVKRAVRADLARFKAFIEMQEVETGAWRGVIHDGERVKKHDRKYDRRREYADFDDIYETDSSHSPQKESRSKRQTRSKPGSSSNSRSKSSGRKSQSSGSRARTSSSRRSSRGHNGSSRGSKSKRNRGASR